MEKTVLQNETVSVKTVSYFYVTNHRHNPLRISKQLSNFQIQMDPLFTRWSIKFF